MIGQYTSRQRRAAVTLEDGIRTSSATSDSNPALIALSEELAVTTEPVCREVQSEDLD
jgi:xanthine dehydrogenase iron-sulfur cluster and FAD-binding subunit A